MHQSPVTPLSKGEQRTRDGSEQESDLRRPPVSPRQDLTRAGVNIPTGRIADAKNRRSCDGLVDVVRRRDDDVADRTDKDSEEDHVPATAGVSDTG